MIPRTELKIDIATKLLGTLSNMIGSNNETAQIRRALGLAEKIIVQAEAEEEEKIVPVAPIEEEKSAPTNVGKVRNAFKR